MGGSRRVVPLRSERGAALIEFALVAPVLLILVLGIIDFGTVYNDWISVRQGVREGARQVVTGRVGTNTTCGASPAPPNDGTAAVVCLTKHRVGLPTDRLRVKVALEGAYTDKRSIVVCAMYAVRSITGFYSSILESQVVRTEVQMRTEQLTTEADPTRTAAAWHIRNFEETALSGQSWSFCSPAATQ